MDGERETSVICAIRPEGLITLTSDPTTLSSQGRDMLSEAMQLCTPLRSAADVSTVLQYFQEPYFALSEVCAAFFFLCNLLRFCAVTLDGSPFRSMSRHLFLFVFVLRT